MKHATKKLIALSLSGFMVASCLIVCPVSAQELDRSYVLKSEITVPGGQNRIDLNSYGESVQSVLRQIAAQGGFNLMIDPSVSGTVSIDMYDITVNQALEAVADLANLVILPKSGNIYLAITKEKAEEKGLNRHLSKVIRINYSNAKRIANVLNSSIFSKDSSGGSASSQNTEAPLARADARTNSVIVVGTTREIALAEQAITRLDIPRESKTFYLSHSNALDVAAMLSSSVFNDGSPSLILNSGGSGSGSAASAGATGSTGNGNNRALPSTMRVDQESIEDGEGIDSFGGGSSGSATGALSQGITLRGTVKTTDTINISPEGALVIPDTRTNAVTIMGTAEQIALAESMIPILDARLPQVAIEATLIEITSEGTKELENSIGAGDGRLQLGFNNTDMAGIAANPDTGRNLIGLPTATSDTQGYGRTGAVFSTNPITREVDYVAQIKGLVSRSKAKILANPTVVATHDTESMISIVDEIVRRTTVEADGITGFTTQTVELGEAGIVLDILPKVGEDGTITMRLRPSVTTVRREERDALNNLITLLSKRDLLTQSVRVRDGETLVIGGLISETENTRHDKLPLLGDLPIVGAMMRASAKGSKRSELVLLITPHILNDTNLTPVSYTQPRMLPGNGHER